MRKIMGRTNSTNRDEFLLQMTCIRIKCGSSQYTGSPLKIIIQVAQPITSVWPACLSMEKVEAVAEEEIMALA